MCCLGKIQVHCMFFNHPISGVEMFEASSAPTQSEPCPGRVTIRTGR